MADDHAQQAQQEEHGHQDEGHVVWLGFRRCLLPGPCRLTGWGSEREDKTVNYYRKLKWMSSQCPSGQRDIPRQVRGRDRDPNEAAVGIKMPPTWRLCRLSFPGSITVGWRWRTVASGCLATEVEGRVNVKQRVNGNRGRLLIKIMPMKGVFQPRLQFWNLTHPKIWSVVSQSAARCL